MHEPDNTCGAQPGAASPLLPSDSDLRAMAAHQVQVGAMAREILRLRESREDRLSRHMQQHDLARPYLDHETKGKPLGEVVRSLAERLKRAEATIANASPDFCARALDECVVPHVVESGALNTVQRIHWLAAERDQAAARAEKAEASSKDAEERAWKALGEPGGTHATTNVERLCKAFEHEIERADLAEKNARASANERLEAISKKLDETLVPRGVPAITGDSILDRIEWLFGRAAAYSAELARFDGISLAPRGSDPGSAPPWASMLDRIRAVVDRVLSAELSLKQVVPPPVLVASDMPDHFLHFAHMPGKWTHSSDEWFVHTRVGGLDSPWVTVSWRHGPGLANSRPETWPKYPPFEGDPRDCKLPEAVIANAIAVSELRALVKFVETEAPPLNCGNNSGHAYWGELRKRVVDFALRRIMVIDITGGKQVGGPVKVDPSVFCTRPETLMPIPEFEQELRALLNRKSKERGSNTPDYVLADFLCRCLEAFDRATRERERWHGDRPAKKAPGS
jgi:hypothetical protein